jgi:hypothetical protein
MARMRRGMVGSFNGFGLFSIEGGSGEDGAGHCFEKRREGSTVNSASLGKEESAGGIRAAATPAEGGGGCLRRLVGGAGGRRRCEWVARPIG